MITNCIELRDGVYENFAIEYNPLVDDGLGVNHIVMQIKDGKTVHLGNPINRPIKFWDLILVLDELYKTKQIIFNSENRLSRESELFNRKFVSAVPRLNGTCELRYNRYDFDIILVSNTGYVQVPHIVPIYMRDIRMLIDLYADAMVSIHNQPISTILDDVKCIMDDTKPSPINVKIIATGADVHEEAVPSFALFLHDDDDGIAPDLRFDDIAPVTNVKMPATYADVSLSVDRFTKIAVYSDNPELRISLPLDGLVDALVKTFPDAAPSPNKKPSSLYPNRCLMWYGDRNDLCNWLQPSTFANETLESYTAILDGIDTYASDTIIFIRLAYMDAYYRTFVYYAFDLTNLRVFSFNIDPRYFIIALAIMKNKLYRHPKLSEISIELPTG